jgi:DNA-binding SARP family transcriptional activator/basic membrane lipoprotein Med (substrate-binding protein (PBP1-ABC) superfamily)
VVPVERLIDEVWGDNPPPSAARSLESYVSRLRQVFNGHGPTLVRRGAGYALELKNAVLDSRTFLELQEEASAAGAKPARALELATAALATWRGPALADVALTAAGRAEAERLEELRLRTYEVRFEAELALGQHEQAIGELRALIGRNPYRERFVAELMLALYRSGRHADALDVYQRTRAALLNDLGLQPSLELQQLSGQIVRQDPQLRRQPTSAPPGDRPDSPRWRPRRLPQLVATGVVVAAVTALSASGSAPSVPAAEGAAAEARIALVLPQAPEAVKAGDPRIHRALSGFETAATGYKTETLVSGEVSPPAAQVERVSRRIESGRFAFVVVLGDGATARAVARLVRQLPDTRFAFLDGSLRSLSLTGVANATGVPFADDESIDLVGYASGLVSPFGGSPGERVDLVSVVAAEPSARTRKLIAAYKRGARGAHPGVRFRVDYSHERVDRTACEGIANRQIDAGSDVILALAGRCGHGALAVARLRGVWGITTEDDRAPEGRHILATTYKNWETASLHVMNAFAVDTLPRGRDVVLGLADDYSVGVETFSGPDRIWSKVVDRCSTIRQRTLDDRL